MVKKILKKINKKIQFKKPLKTKVKSNVSIKKDTKKIILKKLVKKVFKKKIKKIVKKVVKAESVKLEKSIKNPIISPRLYSWESKATFNPTAFISNDKVHLMYRAVGEDDVSVLGYASSFDGYNIYERPTYHAYKRSDTHLKIGEPVEYSSGGGWCGGCEDPRVTLIGDILYMLYTAFDGWGSVRIALTSIKLDDFKKKRWNWEKPILISPPGEIHKNWVIFPEKICPPGSATGKYAILHSFYPKILIDYFDNLDDFDGNTFIKSNNKRPVDDTRGWDSWFRGVGPAPIRIKEGWLILYHAMDHRNPNRYKLGALILDAKNPTKVLYRCNEPILEPEEHYENNGYKWGVVYSCGAVVKEGRLFVYYGGADKVVCVASVEMKELVENLKKHKPIKLNSDKIVKK